MHKNVNARRLALPLLLSLLTVTGCGTTSPARLPVVSKLPEIPSPPAVSEPLPSGGYWERHCKLMQSAQQQLKTTLRGSERCLDLGRTTPPK